MWPVPVAVNYFSVIPKFALIPGELSLIVPISRYLEKGRTMDEDYHSNITSVAPQFLYTYTNRRKTVDLTLGLKGDLVIGKYGGMIFLGSTGGAGFSTNLNRWALRPELGLTYFPGASAAYVSYGIGLEFNLPAR